MKGLFAIAVFALLLVLPACAHTEEAPFETALIAGQNTEAGLVSVWNNGESLFVKYEAFGGWSISETHLSVALSLWEIPQNKNGNPKIGLFQYQTAHEPGTKQFTYQISLAESGYQPGMQLIIAAHSVLFDEGQAIGETGWASGEQFSGNSWAMHFNYILQKPFKEPSLPPMPIEAVFYDSTTSYFDTILRNIPAGYDVSNGQYVGWCVDVEHFINPGAIYEVSLLSSYSSSLPEYAQNENWDLVSYLLNNKHPDASRDDIQDAIWHLVGEEAYPSDPEAAAMADDAIANGEGFVPVSGQLMAAIVDAGPEIQLTIVEVDP
ncbi:MAG: hypothetical protein JW744_04435 [Candidatus Diapherotrites archaeon]|uniref:Uncharacterized protein n=1 Tax=Candidatus Iainarchaeum sp. TaxID=3101447 RepID=A0A938YP26_9ARCH|nr:hypothetical protein [Candidatus Diapherotrites archaeon]